MKNVKFSKTGNPLKVKFIFTGLIAGSYSYKYWKKNEIDSDEPIEKENLTSESYNLLVPNDLNDGRVVELYTYFKGLDINISDYEIKVEIYQGESYLDGDNDKNKVTGEFQDSKIKIKLIGE
jgi:hypothetical protein